MKIISQKSVTTIFFLAVVCLNYLNANAAEETIVNKISVVYHPIKDSQEGSEEEKADHKSLPYKLQNEITRREEVLSSSTNIEITNPKEFFQNREVISVEEDFGKVRSFGWGSEDEDLKRDTNNPLDIHSRKYDKVQNDIVLRSSQLLLPKKTNVIIVIDVFRAFTTACCVLERNPTSYILTNKSTAVSHLISGLQDSFLIGKAERGVTLNYNIPNSPTRVKEVDIKGRNVFHRTEGGASGVLMSKGLGIILAAGLANADATVRYVLQLQNPEITILPMGHEGITPSLEDDICAQYIDAKFRGQTMDLAHYFADLREGPGKYFFTDDQWQYPREDFDCCMDLNRFNFAIHADVQDEYAFLRRLDEGDTQ